MSGIYTADTLLLGNGPPSRVVRETTISATAGKVFVDLLATVMDGRAYCIEYLERWPKPNVLRLRVSLLLFHPEQANVGDIVEPSLLGVWADKAGSSYYPPYPSWRFAGLYDVETRKLLGWVRYE